MGMRNLANHIISIAKTEGLPLKNLQLHKVMFFTVGMHLRKKGIDELVTKTYDIPFEKWVYGPVLESIYYEFVHFKDEDITDKVRGEYQLCFMEWDDTIQRLLQVDMYTLIRVTRDLDSWFDHKHDILERRYVAPYTLDEIKQDFGEAERKI